MDLEGTLCAPGYLLTLGTAEGYGLGWTPHGDSLADVAGVLGLMCTVQPLIL